MKKIIEKPYKINWKLYIVLITISLSFIFLGFNCTFYNNSNFWEVVKNIGFGCLASTIVAFIVEVSNVNDKNIELSKLYEATYVDLKSAILRYIQIWSEICYLIEDQKKYKEEKKKWNEWYDIAKILYFSSSEEKKQRIKNFIAEGSLNFILNEINRKVDFLLSQKPLLSINNIYNNEMDSIIKNFEFVFKCCKNEIINIKNMENFWHMFDALNSDILIYIDSWQDIAYYNNLEIQPYCIFDSNEYAKAMIKSKIKKK